MRDAFLQHLKTQFGIMQDTLAPLRQKAWEKFLLRGLAQREDEAFRYVSLRDLYETPFSIVPDTALRKEQITPHLLPECTESHIVFVNGHFAPHLSALSLLKPLSQAMRSHAQFLQPHLQRQIKEESDPFALLNLALHPAGAFLYLPPKQRMENPVQILYVTTEDVPHVTLPRVQLVLGANTSLNYITTHVHLNGKSPHCAIPFIDIFLDEGATCESLSISSSDWCFDTVRAYLKRDATLKMLHFLGSSKVARHDAYVQLAGENSEVDLRGLWILRGSHQAHAHVTVDHMAPHGRSNQLYKGVLLDASQSSFEGKIMVRQAAQKTEAYQLNNNLILGKAALANSKPNLEIFADDVKASHGATFARPEEAQIFYLKSRGIAEELAKQLLMAGFYRELIEQIPYIHLREKLLSESDMQLRGGL